MVEEKFHHGEVREITLDLFPDHHGGLPTPPWCRENSTMVEWRRHHGEISTAPWCFVYATVVFLLTSPRWKFSFTTVEKFLHHGDLVARSL